MFELKKINNASSSRWVGVSRFQLEKFVQSRLPGFSEKEKPLVNEATDLAELASRFPARSDFGWSLCFEPGLIERLFFEGFLPITANLTGSDQEPIFCLLPKLHMKRCILDLKEIHVSKKARKISKKYSLKFNPPFLEIVQRLCQQHGQNCWLVDPYIDALHFLWRAAEEQSKVRVVTFGLTDQQGEVVAGELGVLVGEIYISMTGFCDREKHSGSGTVQILATTGFLKSLGVQFIDFGMQMDYKDALGAIELRRKDFLPLFHREREKTISFARIQEKFLDAESLNAAPLIEKLAQ